jgi:allophanate hydrolase subunit 2
MRRARRDWSARTSGPSCATLSFAHLRGGARAYIAVAGGIDVPELLGSRSTYALGGLGGFEGRPLAAGDSLPVGDGAGPASSAAVPPDLRPEFANELEIRVVMGLYDHLLTEDGRRTFEDTVWTLTQNADRVGFHYKGSKLDLLEREQTFGEGSDHATVISADMDTVAQSAPGAKTRFVAVDLEAALEARGDRNRRLSRVREALS